jgi:hypothetical protein
MMSDPRDYFSRKSQEQKRLENLPLQREVEIYWGKRFPNILSKLTFSLDVTYDHWVEITYPLSVDLADEALQHFLMDMGPIDILDTGNAWDHFHDLAWDYIRESSTEAA